MPPRLAPSLLVPALLLANACSSATPNSTPTPERVLAIDEYGNRIRTYDGDLRATATFAAPRNRVWNAMVLSYDELQIQPTVQDQTAGRYGNTGFVATQRGLGRPVDQFFNCGSGLTGSATNSGRLVASVVTTLTANPDGTTATHTIVTGNLRRNDGTNTDPIQCSSTGVLETRLREAIQKRLDAKP